MNVRGIVAEDFCNYKVPSMFIISARCDWKCCIEAGRSINVCQNAPLVSTPITELPDDTIVDLYRNNNITRAIVVGGLEPMLQIDELDSLLTKLRDSGCNDPLVIYTGYYPEEIPDELDRLRGRNVIVKFGRYIPNAQSRYDEVLGVTLVSDNQFAEQII